MRRFSIFTFLALSLITFFCNAQEVLVYKNKVSIGELNHLDKDIIADKYIFTEEVFKVDIGSSENLYLVQLRNSKKKSNNYKTKGKLVVLEFNRMAVKWSQTIDYRKENLSNFETEVVKCDGIFSYKLNIEDGTPLWKVATTISLESYENNILMGYRINPLEKDISTFQGISKNTGNILWQREIDNKFGWNEYKFLSDSVMLVVASGLHSINLKSGIGWNYHAVTGKRNYAGTITQVALGVAFGVLTGYYFVMIPREADIVGDIVSNVILDNSSVYLASRDSIFNIQESSGKKIWSSPLPENLASKSSIFIQDSLLYMINYGYAIRNSTPINFGHPFFAAYNTRTGDQEYLYKFKSKKDIVIDYKLNDEGNITIISKDQIHKFSAKSGDIVSTFEVDPYKYGEIQSFVSEDYFVLREDSSFVRLIDVDKEKLWVCSNNGLILGLNKDYEIANHYRKDKLFLKSLCYEDLVFLKNKEETIIIDKNNKRIANIDLSEDAFIKGDMLYDYSEKGLFVVDLKNTFSL